MENNNYPYELLDEYTTKINSYELFIIRKSLIYKFFDKNIEYKNLHKQTLIIFIILLKLTNSIKYTLISQKELATSLHVNEATVTRAMKWLEENQIIETRRRNGKEFKLKSADESLQYDFHKLNNETTCKLGNNIDALKYYIIKDFEDYPFNRNKYFISQLYFELLDCKFIKLDDKQFNKYYKIANELSNDNECELFVPSNTDEDNELSIPSIYDRITPENNLYVAKIYESLSNRKKTLIEFAQTENTSLKLITQGVNFILIDMEVIDYISYLYKIGDDNNTNGIPKSALYIFLYLLTKLDSYKYSRIDRKKIMEELRINKSTISNGFKWLEDNSIISKSDNDKKSYKFMSKINNDDFGYLFSRVFFEKKNSNQKDFIYYDVNQ